MDGCESPMIEAPHTTGQNLQKDFLPPQAEKTALESGSREFLAGSPTGRIAQTEMGTGLKRRVFSGLVNKLQRGG